MDLKKETVRSGGSRERFLKAYWQAYRQWSDLEYHLAVEDPCDKKLALRLALLGDRLYKMRNAYEDGLEPKAISRNPFTGELLSFRIDVEGLDGLWWDYDCPVRPFENAVEGFWSLSGALSLNREIEYIPFKCKPGPDVPFVLKELMEMPNVAAVISQINIGKHTGYPVAYFSKGEPAEYANYNFWGANYGVSYDTSETYGWFKNPVYTEDCDFEIEKWIDNGNLFWIAPGDESMELKQGVENCPYINLTGEKRMKTICDQAVVYEEEIDYDHLEEQ